MKITNDRRKQPRVPLSGAATLFDGRTSLPCDGLDLSVTGIGLRCVHKLKKGRKVQVLLAVGARELTIPAAIKRVRAEGSAFRVGLKFGRLDQARRDVLRALVTDALAKSSPVYQARIFLARGGAPDMDDALVPTNAEAPIPSPADPIVDEDAPTGPTRHVRERSRTDVWTPRPPQPQPPPPPLQPLERIDSDRLRSTVTSALQDLNAEVGLHGTPTPTGTIIADRRELAARSRAPATGTPAPVPYQPPPPSTSQLPSLDDGGAVADMFRDERSASESSTSLPIPSDQSTPAPGSGRVGLPSPFGARELAQRLPTRSQHLEPTRAGSPAPSAVHTQAGTSVPRGGTQVAIRSPFARGGADVAGGATQAAVPAVAPGPALETGTTQAGPPALQRAAAPAQPPSPFGPKASASPIPRPIASGEDDETKLRETVSDADDFASQYERALADLDLESR